MAMLEVKDLEVYYGMIQAIKGISFEVNQGEVIALIGANGAGKTTTLHTITGLLSPKKGSVVFEGTDITKIPAHKIVSMGMAHVVSEMSTFFTDRTLCHDCTSLTLFIVIVRNHRFATLDILTEELSFCK